MLRLLVEGVGVANTLAGRAGLVVTTMERWRLDRRGLTVWFSESPSSAGSWEEGLQ